MRATAATLFAFVLLTGLAQAQPVPVDPYGAVVVQAPVQPVPPAPLPPAPPAMAPGYYYPPPAYAPPVQPYAPQVYSVPGRRGLMVGCAAAVQPTYQPCVQPCYQPCYQPCAPVPCVRPPVVVPVAPVLQRPVMPLPRARFFSINVHGSAMGINQEINGESVTLGGAGFETRFRTRGRFGLSLSLDFLSGRFGDSDGGSVRKSKGGDGSSTSLDPAATEGPYFHVGAVERFSMPFRLTMMVYIFKNEDTRHFNLYFLGGLGAVSTQMSLTDQWGERVKQDFFEYEAHAGIGMELRFRWFAIDANFRGLVLSRDDSDVSGAYYQGVSGGPVPTTSWGYQGNVGIAFWL